MKTPQIMMIVALILAPVGGMLLHTWMSNPTPQPKPADLSNGAAPETAGEGASGAVKIIEWPDLAQYDLKTGKPSELLKNLDGRLIRLPGFMVPLEDNMKLVKEFLLVPDPQACIHYPPPPPNQQVLVQMVGEESASVDWKPVWIEGHLRITAGTTKYGTAIFQVKARHTETYKAGF